MQCGYHIITYKKTGKIHSVVCTKEWINIISKDKYLKVTKLDKLDDDFRQYFNENINNILLKYELTELNGVLVNYIEEEQIISRLDDVLLNMREVSEQLGHLAQPMHSPYLCGCLEHLSIVFDTLYDTASGWGMMYAIDDVTAMTASVLNDIRSTEEDE